MKGRRGRSGDDEGPRGPSQRQLRVAEEIRHRLADIFLRGEIRDPGFRGNLVTISEVRVSPDLKNATAFVMPLGGENLEQVLATLKRVAPWLKGEVARAAELRFAPNLAFKADLSFDEAERINVLLSQPQVAADIGRKPVAIRGRRKG